jgi:hypothetical protein
MHEAGGRHRPGKAAGEAHRGVWSAACRQEVAEHADAEARRGVSVSKHHTANHGRPHGQGYVRGFVFEDADLGAGDARVSAALTGHQCHSAHAGREAGEGERPVRARESAGLGRLGGPGGRIPTMTPASRARGLAETTEATTASTIRPIRIQHLPRSAFCILHSAFRVLPL